MKPVRYPLGKSIAFCIVFVLVFIMISFTKNLFPSSYERLAHGVAGILAALVTIILFLGIDNLNLSSVELKAGSRTIPNFFIGMVAGIILMGLMAGGVLYFTGTVVTTNPNSNVLQFLLASAPLLPLAYMEELGFRSYPFEVLKKHRGLRIAIYTTSLLFGLYHIVNGWSVASSLLGSAIWGLIFGLGAAWGKGVAVPTGIHYAVNLTTAAFGSAETKSLWIVHSDETTANAAGLIYIPAFALLVLGVVLVEIYLKHYNRTSPGN